MSVGNPAPGFYPDRTANVGFVKDLFIEWTSGSSGAVASSPGYNEVVSITRTGTGAYTIQFSQAYNGARCMSWSITQASYAKTGACDVRHVADANEASNGTLKVLTVDGDGDAVDPTTGDVIRVCYQVATNTGYP
jgi:hypothetical protein